MKHILIYLSLIIYSLCAQKYYTKTGLTEFSASVNSFEEIAAKNNSSSAILNIETGEVAVLLFIRAFRFEIALMEEHFNENYLESADFPKAMIKGQLTNFMADKIVNGTYNFLGMLTIRGITKKIKMKVFLKKQNSKIIVSSSFFITPKHFDIEIPNIIKEKISENIKISFRYELIRKV